MNYTQKILKAASINNEANDVLYQVLATIGLNLILCEHFNSVYQNNSGSYFNVVFKDRLNDSSDFQQLVRFSDKYETIKVEPNGLKRCAVYFKGK